MDADVDVSAASKAFICGHADLSIDSNKIDTSHMSVMFLEIRGSATFLWRKIKSNATSSGGASGRQTPKMRDRWWLEKWAEVPISVEKQALVGHSAIRR